jgi:hypothetical protein
MEYPICTPGWENGRNELKEYNIQITPLQEVRWPQEGWIKKKNYTLL